MPIFSTTLLEDHEALSAELQQLSALADCLGEGDFVLMDVLLRDMLGVARAGEEAKRSTAVLPSLQAVLTAFTGLSLDDDAATSGMIHTFSLLNLRPEMSLEEVYSHWLTEALEALAGKAPVDLEEVHSHWLIEALEALTGDTPVDQEDTKWTATFLEGETGLIEPGLELVSTPEALSLDIEFDSESESESNTSGTILHASSPEAESLGTPETADDLAPGDPAVEKAALRASLEARSSRWEGARISSFGSPYGRTAAAALSRKLRFRRVMYPGDVA